MKSTILDNVVLKGGKVINGVVLTPAFTLETPWGDLAFTKRQILTIEYRNPPTVLKDTVRTSQAGTSLEGNLLPDKVKVDVDATGQVLSIPKRDIIGIDFLTSNRVGKLSRATRRKLEKA